MTPMSIEKNKMRNRNERFTENCSGVFVNARSPDRSQEAYEMEMPRRFYCDYCTLAAKCAFQVLHTIPTRKAFSSQSLVSNSSSNVI